jgi:cell division protein FtsQ
MARKNGPTPGDQEFSSHYGSTRAEVDFYPARDFDEGETIDSARLTDDESDQESPFLRAQKRVPVRRGPLPKKTANRLKIGLLAALVAGSVAGVLFAVHHYATTSWRFQIESSDSIQISGNENVTRDEVLAVFGEDISRNIFKVSLDGRKQKLEQIPWVETATVMRYLPNRLAVVVKERTPVAFVQTDSRIALIDASGVVMELPPGAKYSFPALVGFSDAEPLSTRVPRMKIFSALMRDLDSGGRGYSQDISDVDLTDPNDVKMTAAQGSVLIHACTGNLLAAYPGAAYDQKCSAKDFLEQYEKYLAVVSQCRARFGTAKLDVDTRFVGQVPCKPIGATNAAAEQAAPAGQDMNEAATEAAPPAPTTKPVAKHSRARKGKKH